jgi:4-amino-4-deoxy-L-arabinose transferase-like glycosyltransferase
LWKILSPLRVFAPPHFFKTVWFMRPGLALAACLSVALPWYLWVGARTNGAFLEGFFLEHHFGRATQAMEGHSGPLVYYPIAILVGFFPWSVFAVPVVLEVVRRIQRRDVWMNGYIFACCWVCVYVGAFTVARTKLPSYVTPCYPALALVAGCFIYRWAEKTALLGNFWPRVAMLAYGLVGLVLVAALPFVIHQTLPGVEWLAAFGLIPILGSVTCWVLFERARPQQAAVAFAVSAAAFVMAMFVVAAGQVDQHQKNHVLFQAIKDRGGDIKVGAFRCLEPTWVFYGGRPINQLTSHRNWVERNGSWVIEPEIRVRDFLEQSPNACIITTDEHLAKLRRLVPNHFDVVAEAPYFLRRRQLVVVGPTNIPQQTTATAPAKGRLR